MEKVFLDTGAFVGLFNPKDKCHEKARAIFHNIQKRGWSVYTSDYVLDETLTLVKNRSHAGIAIQSGQAIMTSKRMIRIHMNPDLFEGAWHIFQKYADQDFSFTDCSTMAVMKELDIKHIFTFDTTLADVGGYLLAQ